MFSNMDLVNITSVLPVQRSIPSADWWSQKFWIFCLLGFVFLSARWVNRTGNIGPCFSILFCTSISKTCFFFLLTEGNRHISLQRRKPKFYAKSKLEKLLWPCLGWGTVGEGAVVPTPLPSCLSPLLSKTSRISTPPSAARVRNLGMQLTECYGETHI